MGQVNDWKTSLLSGGHCLPWESYEHWLKVGIFCLENRLSCRLVHPQPTERVLCGIKSANYS